MKLCAITGAADGIGRALALHWAREGARVVGFDVDAERAARTAEEIVDAGGEARFVTTDLATREGREEVVETLKDDGLPDVFVHNAGLNQVGPFDRVEFSGHRRVLELNLFTPMALTSRLLSQDLLRKGASLVFLSSLSYYVGYPGAAGYAASKDGLAAYAGSLAARLAPRGIHVMTVFPGPTRTEHARRHSPPGAKEERRMPPAELAQRIVKGVERRQRILVPGIGNRLFAAVGQAWPGISERAMKKVIFDKLQIKE